MNPRIEAGGASSDSTLLGFAAVECFNNFANSTIKIEENLRYFQSLWCAHEMGTRSTSDIAIVSVKLSVKLDSWSHVCAVLICCLLIITHIHRCRNK